MIWNLRNSIDEQFDKLSKSVCVVECWWLRNRDQQASCWQQCSVPKRAIRQVKENIDTQQLTCVRSWFLSSFTAIYSPPSNVCATTNNIKHKSQIAYFFLVFTFYYEFRVYAESWFELERIVQRTTFNERRALLMCERYGGLLVFFFLSFTRLWVLSPPRLK